MKEEQLSFGKDFDNDQSVEKLMTKKEKTPAEKIAEKKAQLVKEHRLAFGAKTNPFGVETEAELDRALASMSTIELQRLCIDASLSATGSPTFLRQKIRKEFKRVSNSAV